MSDLKKTLTLIGMENNRKYSIICNRTLIIEIIKDIFVTFLTIVASGIIENCSISFFPRGIRLSNIQQTNNFLIFQPLTVTPMGHGIILTLGNLL